MNSQTSSLFKNISKKPEIIRKCNNFIKILNITKEGVENKIYEILPISNIYGQSTRNKRGLINGLGSIFKAITGNLDANDGEHFENLIQQLGSNQVKLQKQILATHSLSKTLIQKFNESLNEIYHHEELIGSNLEVIQTFINKQTVNEGIQVIKDVTLQLINIYQIINQKLQDIENSITFSKLGTLHSSIVTQKDLLLELRQFRIKQNQLPFELTIENIHLMEKIIKMSSYIYNNRITYILTIPVYYATDFDYFQFVPIPRLTSKNSSLFSTLLPNYRYVLLSKMYFAYGPANCQKLPQAYSCDNINLRESPESEDTCELSILTAKSSNQNCKIVQSYLTEPLIYQLEETNQWIAVFNKPTRIQLHCNDRESYKLVHGSYIFKIPQGCLINTPEGTLSNNERRLENTESFEFEIKDAKTVYPKINLSMEHFKNNFKDLPSLENIEYINELSNPNSQNPWNFLSFIVIVIFIICVCYKIFVRIRIHLQRSNHGEITIPARSPPAEVIQLPNIRMVNS